MTYAKRLLEQEKAQQEIEEIRKQINVVGQELAAEQTRFDHLRTKRMDVYDEVENLQEEKNRLEKSIESLVVDLTRLEKEYEHKKKEIDKLIQNVDESKKQLSTMRSKLLSREERYQKSSLNEQLKIARLQEQREQLALDVKHLHKRKRVIDEVLREKRLEEDQITQQRAGLQEKERELDKIVKDNERLTKRNEQLISDISILKSRYGKKGT